MSDLSRLLDDVYRTTPPAPTPAWSPGTAALDEVFSNWIPGPAPAPVDEPGAAVVEEIEVLPEPTAPLAADVDLRAPQPHRAGLVWSIADDDILPPKRARRIRLRHR
ncbi:MAG: hypothetical protein JWN67_3072 [Actinomycetia bacterium]|nr:hypothetical protein [Actinomycetes bacterium]